MTDRILWRTFVSDRRLVMMRSWEDRAEFEPHDHDFYELVLIRAGSAQHVTASGSERIAAGDLLLLAPGVWHEYREGLGLSGCDCLFSRTLLHGELSWITDDPVLGRLLLRSVGTAWYRRPVIVSLGAERRALVDALLIGAERDDGDGRSALALGSLLTVLGILAEELRPRMPSEPPRRPSPVATALVSRALAVLGEDHTRAWSAAGLAEALGVTAGSLNRAFRTVVGRSAMAHRAHMQMEHAAMLLLRTDLPVGDIGARIGLFDANYFARRFRAAMGQSASAYRARFRDPG